MNDTSTPLQSLVEIPAGWTGREELEEPILSGTSVRLGRIISRGHTTARGTWYDQDEDEWVALLQGQATILLGDHERVSMRASESLLIPAHVRHRVEYTSTEPPCVWLTLHGRLRRGSL